MNNNLRQKSWEELKILFDFLVQFEKENSISFPVSKRWHYYHKCLGKVKEEIDFRIRNEFGTEN